MARAVLQELHTIPRISPLSCLWSTQRPSVRLEATKSPPQHWQTSGFPNDSTSALGRLKEGQGARGQPSEGTEQAPDGSDVASDPVDQVA